MPFYKKNQESCVGKINFEEIMNPDEHNKYLQLARNPPKPPPQTVYAGHCICYPEPCGGCYTQAKEPNPNYKAEHTQYKKSLKDWNGKWENVTYVHELSELKAKAIQSLENSETSRKSTLETLTNQINNTQNYSELKKILYKGYEEIAKSPRGLPIMDDFLRYFRKGSKLALSLRLFLKEYMLMDIHVHLIDGKVAENNESTINKSWQHKLYQRLCIDPKEQAAAFLLAKDPKDPLYHSALGQFFRKDGAGELSKKILWHANMNKTYRLS